MHNKLSNVEEFSFQAVSLSEIEKQIGNFNP